MALARTNRQAGFLDAVTGELGGPKTAALLDRLHAAVDWNALAAPVRALPTYTNPGPGRRPWDVVVMLKGLLLAKWFNLSDPSLEEMLKDRLSFRRFVGLSLEDDTPDETTFVKFRGRLREADLDEVLFERALQQLDDRGLVLQEGTLVDATILEASKGTKKTVADEDGTRTNTTTRDQDASFTKKHGRTYLGYKMHVATDTRGVIKQVIADTAKVHDSNHFEALIGDELDGSGAGAAYADSAYASKKHTALMERHQVHDGTIKRRTRGQAELPWYQQHINRLNAKVRAVVEHPFAWIKQMGHRRVRYRGLRRNALDFTLIALAYNLKRSLSLTPA
jgi:IS5 family transposase